MTFSLFTAPLDPTAFPPVVMRPVTKEEVLNGLRMVMNHHWMPSSERSGDWSNPIPLGLPKDQDLYIYCSQLGATAVVRVCDQETVYHYVVLDFMDGKQMQTLVVNLKTCEVKVIYRNDGHYCLSVWGDESINLDRLKLKQQLDWLSGE